MSDEVDVYSGSYPDVFNLVSKVYNLGRTVDKRIKTGQQWFARHMTSWVLGQIATNKEIRLEIAEALTAFINDKKTTQGLGGLFISLVLAIAKEHDAQAKALIQAFQKYANNVTLSHVAASPIVYYDVNEYQAVRLDKEQTAALKRGQIPDDLTAWAKDLHKGALWTIFNPYKIPAGNLHLGFDNHVHQGSRFRLPQGQNQTQPHGQGSPPHLPPGFNVHVDVPAIQEAIRRGMGQQRTPSVPAPQQPRSGEQPSQGRRGDGAFNEDPVPHPAVETSIRADLATANIHIFGGPAPAKGTKKSNEAAEKEKEKWKAQMGKVVAALGAAAAVVGVFFPAARLVIGVIALTGAITGLLVAFRDDLEKMIKERKKKNKNNVHATDLGDMPEDDPAGFVEPDAPDWQGPPSEEPTPPTREGGSDRAGAGDHPGRDGSGGFADPPVGGWGPPRRDPWEGGLGGDRGHGVFDGPPSPDQGRGRGPGTGSRDSNPPPVPPPAPAPEPTDGQNRGSVPAPAPTPAPAGGGSQTPRGTGTGTGGTRGGGRGRGAGGGQDRAPSEPDRSSPAGRDNTGGLISGRDRSSERAGEMSRAGEGDLATPSTPSGTSSSCFVAGTPIRMANGQLKAIESVRVGDMVLGHLVEKGLNATRRVIGLERGFATELVEVRLSDGSSPLRCTPTHRFAVSSHNGKLNWAPGGKLGVGQRLITTNGVQNESSTIYNTERLVFDGIEGQSEDEDEAHHSLTTTRSGCYVYNFSVEEVQNYFVGEGGILVHNKKTREERFPSEDDRQVPA